MRHVALALAILVGCRGTPDADEPDVSGSAASAAPVKPHIPHLDHEVDVFVGPDRVATLSQDDVNRGVELDTFLSAHPIDTWAALVVYRDGSDRLEWLDPATNFKDQVPLVYLAGTRPAVGFFYPADVAARANATVDATPVTAVRIEVAKHKRSQLEELAAGCRPEPKSELAVLIVPEHWKGTTTQFNIPMHWRTDLKVNLSDGVVGERVGSINQVAVEWGEHCLYDLYRSADRHGRWAVTARLREGDGGCVHSGHYELTCTGDKLSLLGYYPNGSYVERGMLAAVP